ncbi:hypothetical protein BB559_001744 [Furculomyces boomerangus]|uniref:Myb-like domain-containing protein n=1 Tax=Furculomyces boomerangus TaxID=61424 RepID=A0A2T9Z129_9FUNG|nr:hypothetical protein BB559_001744 [Furculomyces boomerangus]
MIETKPTSEFFQISYHPQIPSSSSLSQDSIIDQLRKNISNSRSVKDLLIQQLNTANLNNPEPNLEDQNWEDAGYVQLDEKTSSMVKDLISQSEKIERVCKERIFEEEVTEREMEIIKQRVELQQKQFAMFERREFAVKSKKIRDVFEYLNDEEIVLTLKKTKNNEEEAIIQLSAPGFLIEIRKEIAQQYQKVTVSQTMTDIQRRQYEQLLKKRTNTQKKTTTEAIKKKYHTVGRLPLDKALEQLRAHTQNNNTDWTKNKSVNLDVAMKGWSLARVKAFKAIKTKPNTYYYRFNAPGEVQRVGQWSSEEKRLFHARLAEIGANGQWGIFSMTIPGRVGYQCSNYYRFLIENSIIKDPNYVLDSKGKAHYLFTTKRKNADGSAVKEFRTHNKRPKGKGRRKTTNNDISDGISESELDSDVSDSGSGSATYNSNKYKSSSNRGYKRRKMSDSDDEIRANEVSLSSDDLSVSSSDKEYYQAPPRLGSRHSSRINSSTNNSDSGRSSTIDVLDGTRSKRLESTRSRVVGANEGKNFSLIDELYGGNQGSKHSHEEKVDDDSDGDYNQNYEADEFNPNNPLPDFIDPITLEKVTKPAISPFGHVMDYDSWIRCLMFPPDGSQRNICPLTKNPLNKRELVVLTFDNIDEYRSKIVNM